MPCASVSAKRTATSVAWENRSSGTAKTLVAAAVKASGHPALRLTAVTRLERGRTAAASICFVECGHLWCQAGARHVPGTWLYNSAMSAKRLAALIREHRPCVVLTGAGVSTESGIPDFRSPGGIWARYDPTEYATIEAFRRDPVKVWDFYARRLDVLKEARPNAAHLALAALERAGFVEAVVTQNIDRLHELAGSQDVIEVHGSIRTSSCLACGEPASLDDVVCMLEQAPAPACARCGSILKPDVVMFGELIPEEAMERASE